MNDLEKKLARLHHRDYCVLVGNGTTALYLAITSQSRNNQRIAVANNVCLNAVLPVYFSDNIPVYVDIEKRTLGIDLELLKKERVDSVIAVHAYGNICDIENIEDYCKKNNIFLIEDLALSEGVFYKKRPAGSFGDISILSFGAGKVIDIGHGGALLTDNEDIFQKILQNNNRLRKFEPRDEYIIDSINTLHKRLYNVDFGKTLHLHYKEFRSLCFENQNHFLYQFDEQYYEKLDKQIDNIPYLLNQRHLNVDFLNEKFKAADIEYIEILESQNNSAYWRYNIFLKKYRDELFKYLLEKKYKVSSWYHSVNLLFENSNETKMKTPVSEWVGNSIINIWVNEEIDEVYLNSIFEEIINFLKSKECQ